jgi:hypothetical protein
MRTHCARGEARDYSSVNLRDFESLLLLFFSEEEIEALQAAIEKRRSSRLARELKEDYPGSYPGLVEQPEHP